MNLDSLGGAALVLALLAGCGGGDGPSHPPAAIVIQAEGDSTMYGIETVDGRFVQAAHPVPAQARLRAWFGQRVTIDARGAPGANLEFDLQGTHDYGTPLQLRLAASPARIVIENFGINDAWLPAEAYRANLVRFVDLVRASGKLPVLEEPNPVCAGHAPLAQRVGILDEVARDKQVALVKQYDAILALPDWQSMLTDCVHPGDALYAFKAGREADVLAQVIRQAAW